MGTLLIINADDLGYDPAVSAGIVEAMRHGVVSSSTFMVNTPHSADAAKQATGLALGLHFNLARWAPVSAVPSSLLVNGELAEARAADLPVEVVEAEALAQLRRFSELTGKTATHVDVHKHLHRLPNVIRGLAAAAKKARLPVRSIDPQMRAFLRSEGVPTNDHFIGDAGAEAYWTLTQLEDSVRTLPKEGVVELMCHPGHAPVAVKSGYAAQREVELATFLHPRAKELLASVRVGNFSAI
jgi:predicted glycoside hydrolase/deacetylase ChbG (UPF0249 family)